ncbi:MAG: nucleotidyltransferase family protein [Clostridia bacterium]|nr:nucleotidyltransferase family protein [Clostridia bacterium]
MKAIILAAGYATRLYPLTIDKPKALLPIAGKPIIDYIVDQIETIGEIDELVVVSNHKFYPHFTDWANERQSRLNLIVLNDNTTDDTNKLGAIGDIEFAIENLKLDDDILVMAGDNIFTFKLKDYYNAFKENGCDQILVKELSSIDDLRRMANVVTDENGFVTDMEEKPQNPKTNLAAFASYIYKKDTVPMIKKYLDEGNNPDAPGFFPSWLYKHKKVFAYKFTGECYDIGTPQSYKEVNEIFEKLK